MVRATIFSRSVSGTEAAIKRTVGLRQRRTARIVLRNRVPRTTRSVTRHVWLRLKRGNDTRGCCCTGNNEMQSEHARGWRSAPPAAHGSDGRALRC